MAEGTIRLEVAVPDRRVVDAEAVSVQVPLATGYMGVLAGHAPLLAEMGTGVLSYSTPDGADERAAVDGGVAEILPDCVRIVAGTAERSSEIDAGRARDARERALERLRSDAGTVDTDAEQRAAARAQARIDAAAAA